jgi:hypothetical protein
VASVRALLAKARMTHCEAGCASCPGQETGHTEADEMPVLIAAE